jgi:hypothetical protein
MYVPYMNIFTITYPITAGLQDFYLRQKLYRNKLDFSHTREVEWK